MVDYWQGYIISTLEQPGAIIQSPFGINNLPVFGADSDHTTLAISILEYLKKTGHTIDVVSMPDHIDTKSVSHATGVNVSDEKCEWNILTGDEALLVCTKGEITEIPKIETIVEVDKEFHQSMVEAWSRESSAANVSQGAYVSLSQYEHSIDPRLAMKGQLHNGKIMYPPREQSEAGVVLGQPTHSLEKTGIILSWTTLSAAGAPSEFVMRAPLLGGMTSILTQLESGTNGIFLMVDDEDPVLDFDLRVEFVVRRLYAQDGYMRYGRKARVIVD